MARITFNECYALVRELETKENPLSIGKLTEALIRYALTDYFDSISLIDVSKSGILSEVIKLFHDNGIVDQGVAERCWDKLNKSVRSKINSYDRNYRSPIRFVSGVLTIPYLDLAPSASILNRIDTKLVFQTDILQNIIDKYLSDWERFKDTRTITIDYLEYAFKNHFIGFVKEESHPLSDYFGKEELLELLPEDECEDSKDLDFVDLILLVFGELEKMVLDTFNNIFEGIGITPNDIVYVYVNTIVGKVSVYKDKSDIQTTFFKECFDPTTNKPNVCGGRLNGYCEYHRI